MSHPALLILKQAFPAAGLSATVFRGGTTVLVPAIHLHGVLAALKAAGYDQLADLGGVDYLGYPQPMAGAPDAAKGRFAVVYNLVATGLTGGPELPRLLVKVTLDPSLPTDGTELDPALVLPSVCDLWPGAEWMEREVFDMFGLRFDGHPDLRRILLWEDYPAFPLRKDYPLRGRGEREFFAVVDRDTV